MFGTTPEALSIQPTMQGPHGRAWAVNFEALRIKLGVKTEDDATLASWVVEAPWANPAWHSYWLALLHLRPMPGKRDTLIYLAGATHELWLYALDPTFARAPTIRGAERPHLLTPLNFAAQFVEATDRSAIERVRNAVGMITMGTLSPDTDYIRHWMQLFGDNMLKDKMTAGSTRIVAPALGIDLTIPAKLAPGEDR